ncbi:SDR family NAD(P)-dependent oxidoreductase [Ereboglobus luteus]|uniref:Short-chain dehydrogenase n=1 Tax=Ereboglobus luteus TaxID=1796921 RepID=A0A2U8E180_9BACT|nr:SDR family NAD(P)-dependent oxidoreductase [Ereboglobus luteus]AWI08613.1 hypothetical protein CKA38_04495 [Ereboglobus luteus]
MLSQKYKTAFITGASSGIGRAIAEMLLAEGVRVWGTARDTARLAPLAQKHPGAFTPVALDLDDSDAAMAALEKAACNAGATGTTADALGLTRSFDIVINNAGYGAFAPFASVDFSLWQKQLDAMLATTARLAQTAFRAMQARRRGCLVNISSLVVDFPLPYMSGYNMAKAGLSALSASLAFEARGTPVCVIDFRPGDYRTSFNHVMQPASGNPAGVAQDERVASVWKTVDAQFNAAPLPERAARDLRRALRRGRSGTVRSGTFFQARLAPLGARLLPGRLLRAIAAHYFGDR